MKKLGSLTSAIVLVGASAWAFARIPENLADLEREMNIFEDIVVATIRNSTDPDLLIRDIEAEYLAEQGVMISMEVARSWFDQRDVLATQRGLATRVPEMVHNILADLEISIAPFEPEALEELRELREEQRQLRREQRELRSSLREQRRRRALSDNPNDIDHHIDDLKRQLAASEAEYDALEGDIDNTYERLRDLRSMKELPREATADDLKVSIVEATCTYGGTLKSLPDDQHLTLVVKQGRLRTVYVFRQRDVNACSAEDIDAAELQARSYIY